MCQFTSHTSDFDYLKSLEIEPKINRLRFCKQQTHNTQMVLATNGSSPLWLPFSHPPAWHPVPAPKPAPDALPSHPTDKTIKLWKCSKRKVSTAASFGSRDGAVLQLPTLSRCEFCLMLFLRSKPPSARHACLTPRPAPLRPLTAPKGAHTHSESFTLTRMRTTSTHYL
jgi:hypothetical protein